MGAIKNLIIWLLSVILAFIGGLFTMQVATRHAIDDVHEERMRKYQHEEERV